MMKTSILTIILCFFVATPIYSLNFPSPIRQNRDVYPEEYRRWPDTWMQYVSFLDNGTDWILTRGEAEDEIVADTEFLIHRYMAMYDNNQNKHTNQFIVFLILDINRLPQNCTMNFNQAFIMDWLESCLRGNNASSGNEGSYEIYLSIIDGLENRLDFQTQKYIHITN